MQLHPEELSLLGDSPEQYYQWMSSRFARGLVLSKTYAHVMWPFMLAFRRPERVHQHDPGPWKSTQGGVWLDRWARKSTMVPVEMTEGVVVRTVSAGSSCVVNEWDVNRP